MAGITVTAAAARAESPFFHGPRELAKYFGESESATRRRLYRGEFPYIKMGNRVLIRKSEVEARLAEFTIDKRNARRGRRRVG